MVVYNKLVRDLIPDIIEKEGKQLQIRTLSDADFQSALINKLQEEAAEFADQPSLEELADILEVIQALAQSLGSNMETVQAIRKQKAQDRGGFEKRVYLEWVA